MIPFTFPSNPSSVTGEATCKVWYLSSVAGLVPWTDYTPVRSYTSPTPICGRVDANGYQAVEVLSSISGLQAGKDYIAVYEDATATKAWSTDVGGYIPVGAAGSTLSLQFAGASALDSRITFTRASSATFTNSSGLIELATTDTPRFDYDPVTLAPKGLLIEEARTNLLLNSLIDGTSLATQNITTTAAARTLSFYGTGEIVLSGTHSATVTGTGAYPTRTTLTYTPTAGTLTLTVTGTVQYAQDELGSFSTSFIPTAGASATRAVDNASMTGTNFSDWYNATEGTLLVEWYSNAKNSTAHYPANLNDNTANNRISTYSFSGFSPAIRVAGVNTFTVTSTSYNVTLPRKDAIAYKANDSAAAENGSLLTVTAQAPTMPTLTRLDFGALNGLNSALAALVIQRISYFPRRLTNAQMQALTT